MSVYCAQYLPVEGACCCLTVAPIHPSFSLLFHANQHTHTTTLPVYVEREREREGGGGGGGGGGRAGHPFNKPSYTTYVRSHHTAYHTADHSPEYSAVYSPDHGPHHTTDHIIEHTTDQYIRTAVKQRTMSSDKTNFSSGRLVQDVKAHIDAADTSRESGVSVGEAGERSPGGRQARTGDLR